MPPPWHVGDGWGEGEETPDEALARVGAELARR
jgi:hypothetical protein